MVLRLARVVALDTICMRASARPVRRFRGPQQPQLVLGEVSVCAGGPRCVELFGLPFACVTQDSLLELIGHWIQTRGAHWIVTANVQQVGMADRDSAYRTLLAGADVITADGMPICWVGRALGRPLPARVTGSDLIEPLAARAAQRGWRLFLLGGEEGVADELRERLQTRHPGLQVVGTWAPPQLSLEEVVESPASSVAARRVREARPDVVLVAFGSPKQDLWIARHRDALAVPVAIGVGGSFDFLVGRQRRAPEWMRRMGAEWLHRVLSSPGRLGPRYAREGLTFLRLTLRELRAGRA